MLKTESNTPNMDDDYNDLDDNEDMERRVMNAYSDFIRGDAYKTAQADFEHGQWWVTELDTGRQYSVCDAEGPGTFLGFCFELVSEGDR